MPLYIASGKDELTESSIKVFGDTDMEALLAAKKLLPVVTGLERIEADGTLTPVSDLPFDDNNIELTTHSEKSNRERELSKKKQVAVVVAVCFMVFKLAHCAYQTSLNSKAMNSTLPAAQPRR